MADNKDKPHDAKMPPDRQEVRRDAPADDDFLYLYIPPGRYEMPPETLPMDLNVLERAIPGSEIRSMSQVEYRRMIELQKKRKEDS